MDAEGKAGFEVAAEIEEEDETEVDEGTAILNAVLAEARGKFIVELEVAPNKGLVDVACCC